MRNIRDIAGDKVREIDEFVSAAPIIYKEVNLKELLVVINYLQFKQSFLKRSLNKAREVLVDYFPRKNRLSEKTNYSPKRKFKYIFIFSYELSSIHNASILLNLFNEIKDKRKILVITQMKSVYLYFDAKDVSCHFFSLPRFPHFSIKSPEKFSVKQKVHLENGKLLLDSAEKILERAKPKVLLTIQDMHFFDQCFVHIAKRKKVLSITHQHGAVPEFLSLWKYVFSDYMIVWGEHSKRILSRYLDADKLIALGTDKFNYLKNAPPGVERSSVTLAISEVNIFSDYKKATTEFLIKVLLELEVISEYLNDFVIKLHPSMNESEWKKRAEKIFADHSLSYDCRVVSKADNTELLNKSKFLIYNESTISLEAQICDCSLIQLCLSEVEKDPGKVFIDDLHNELKRRITDNEYNNEIIRKQRQNLKKRIADFNSSKAELEFIDSLIQ